MQLIINTLRLMFCLVLWIGFMLVLLDGTSAKDAREAGIGGAGALATCLFMKYEFDRHLRG